ncbi:MAG: molybdopterin-dependent oxidoreductase [Thermomicrobiales bacterium]
MSWSRRAATLAAGVLSGLVAAIVMMLIMVAGRYWLGISPLPESIPDRIAPTLSIKEFFDLFGKYGGYNGLKKFGIKSGIEGIVAAGVIVGLIYSVIVESRRSRSWGTWRFGLSKLALVVVGVLILLMWIGTVIFLKPVLHTNYRGLPPSRARILNIVGLLVTYSSFAVALISSYRLTTKRDPEPRTVPIVEPETGMLMPSISGAAAEMPVPVGQPSTRRALLAAGAGALIAAPTYKLIDTLYNRAAFDYDGTVYSGPGVQPLVPNDKFYTVTKNVVDPNVKRSIWGLEISGLVDHGRTYDFDDISAMTPVEQETTLMCISNAVGAGLSSNAVWTGVPMRDLLNASGVGEGAVEVKLYGADGYTDTFSIEKALDPTTMIVYLMNGEPLPQRHGFPARVIVPGLYGEKNVKWVTGIEVLDHDGKGFYETQGWGPNFVIPTRSDIFSPKRTRRNGQDSFDKSFSVNQTVELRGRAFAGDRGVKLVEISLDNGATWQPTTIDYPGTRLTWVFWSYRWTPRTAGDYVLICRATDQNGDLQSSEVRGTAPQGATGLHKVKAHVQ